MENDTEVCCPKFDPTGWDGKTLQWKDKLFVKDHVVSFLHIPLNMDAVMTRICKKMDAVGANDKKGVMLCDEKSLWGADIYFEAVKEVPDAQMTTLSGTFLCRVFEGEYRMMGDWVKEMEKYLKENNQTMSKLYAYYTSCPKCAKKYGKNYVVLLAQIG